MSVLICTVLLHNGLGILCKYSFVLMQMGTATITKKLYAFILCIKIGHWKVLQENCKN